MVCASDLQAPVANQSGGEIVPEAAQLGEGGRDPGRFKISFRVKISCTHKEALQEADQIRTRERALVPLKCGVRGHHIEKRIF